MNPPGQLLCSQMFVKTEEVSYALGTGYKIQIQYDHICTANVYKIHRAEKDRKEMYQGVHQKCL